MMHNIHSSSLNPSLVSVLGGESLGLPETGEFDFLNYLLGLQGTTTDNPLELEGTQAGLLQGLELEPDSGVSSGLQASDSDKSVLELFDKKELARNPLLLSQPMVGAYLPNAPAVQATAVDKNQMVGTERQSLLDKSSLMPVQKGQDKKSENKNALEDPIGQLALKTAMLDQNGKSVLPSQADIKAMASLPKDQKEKLIQTYTGMKKQPLPEMETLSSSSEKMSMEKAGLEGEKIEHLDKSKRRGSKEGSYEIVSDFKGSNAANGIGETNSKPGVAQKVSNHTVPELFHKVESMVHHGGGKMTVMLTPADLGQVEIHVSTKGKNVEVSVKSDNDFAKAAIESQVADLQQSLQNQDLNLSKIEVHVSREMDPSFLENQYAGFSGQGSLYQQSQSNRQESSQRSAWQSDTTEGSLSGRRVGTGDVTKTSSRVSALGNGRVDIRI